MGRTSPDRTAEPGAASSITITDDDLRGAVGRHFRRQAPLNATVTVPVVLITGAILWSSAPHIGVLCWAGAHLMVCAAIFLRWLQVRGRKRDIAVLADSSAPSHAERSPFWLRHFGFISSVFSGLIWGTTALFLPYVPPTQQMLLIIVVSSMAAGATTTLASIPIAANAFVLASILPFAVYFALQDEVENIGLAVMALVMTAAMIVSTRLVHRMVSAELAAQTENHRLLRQLATARREWLDISQSTEAFALFDANDELVLWNDNLGRILALPFDALRRGAKHRDLLAVGARPVRVDDETAVDHDAWVEKMLHQADTPGLQITTHLDNDLWLRSHARRTSSGSLVVVYVDITAVKRAEEALLEREAELRQASKLEAVGKLAGGVAHDFNNILTVIMGYAQLLELQSVEKPAALEAAQQINRAAERAASLTRQLLAFSRKQALQPKVVDLNEIIRDMDKLLRRLVPRTINLQVALDAQIGFVQVDPHQMEQVVVNLVINGCDAMPGGGTLHIETSGITTARGGEVVLRISDSGVGMDEATRERAFEPFFTTKQPGQGTGLGLASAYGFVRQSGGDIRVTSAPGQGSEFAIHLPCAAPEQEPESSRDVPDGRAPESATVLVVEDEAVVRTLVVETLRREGYHVLEAEDGNAALRASRAHSAQIELLLTDVVMPEMNGWELAAQLRIERPDTRQLFMSGYVGDGNGGHERGDAVLLAKPFTMDDLLLHVRQVLAASANNTQAIGGR